MRELASNLLDLLRVRGTAYFGKMLDAPWGMDIIEQDHLCRFHLVLSGAAWVGLPGQSAREELAQGDFAIIPHGQAHFLEDLPGREVRMHHSIPEMNLLPQFDKLHDKDGSTHLLCGYFEFAGDMPQVLISQMPNLLITRWKNTKRSNQIGYAVDSLTCELSGELRPQQAILNRLTEVIFFHALGEWLDDTVMNGSPPNALNDPKLLRVFDEIHATPSTLWTVDDLAKIAGQSRTAFANHFKNSIGVSPMIYITRWRVEVARRMLGESTMGLDEIALKVGYQDTNAFSRAFKRVTGSPPGMFRRSSQS